MTHIFTYDIELLVKCSFMITWATLEEELIISKE